MFITDATKSYIAYKDLFNNCVIVFNNAGELVINHKIKCNNWQPLNLFEVPVKVLESLIVINN